MHQLAGQFPAIVWDWGWRSMPIRAVIARGPPVLDASDDPATTLECRRWMAAHDGFVAGFCQLDPGDEDYAEECLRQTAWC
jgi:hypothetical protein